MIVTRFNPTVNGNLHLGHVYSLYVNEYFAHSVGGRFFVRFDDTSNGATIEMKNPELAKEFLDQQVFDIGWLGMFVNEWSKQSDILNILEDEIKTKITHNYNYIFPDPYPHTLPISVRMLGTGWIAYPYTPQETAERVIMDRHLGITHIIRGEEFLTEFSLYRYFCDVFNYPHPKFIFLPRLVGSRGDISKTTGGYTIVEMRANGYTPQDIKELLSHACLNYFGDDWSIYNLKSNPRLTI